MPGPWSRTVTSPAAWTLDLDLPPCSGLHLTALSSRFETARSRARLDPAHGAGTRLHADPHPRRPGPGSLDRALDQPVEPHRPRGLAVELDVAGEVDQVADQQRQLVEL